MPRPKGEKIRGQTPARKWGGKTFTLDSTQGVKRMVNRRSSGLLDKSACNVGRRRSWESGTRLTDGEKGSAGRTGGNGSTQIAVREKKVESDLRRTCQNT